MAPATRQRGAAAIALALVSATAFGLSGPFAKALLDAGWSPSAAVLARVGGAAAVLAPLVVRAWRRQRPSAATLRIVLVYGLTAVAGTQLAYFSAVRTLTVGVALLLEFLAPILLVGLAWARTRRAPRRGTVLGAVLAMGGLVLVLDLGGDVSVDPVGVAWGLTAALGLSTYFLLSERVDDRLPPVVLAGGGLAVGAVVMAVLGVVGVLPLRATSTQVEVVGQTVHWIVPVVVLACVSTVAAYLTGIAAVTRLGARVGSFLALTEVPLTVVAAWLLLGELPLPVQLLGGVGIIGGVALVYRDAAEPARPVEPLEVPAG